MSSTVAAGETHDLTIADAAMLCLGPHGVAEVLAVLAARLGVEAELVLDGSVAAGVVALVLDQGEAPLRRRLDQCRDGLVAAAFPQGVD